ADRQRLLELQAEEARREEEEEDRAAEAAANAAETEAAPQAAADEASEAEAVEAEAEGSQAVAGLEPGTWAGAAQPAEIRPEIVTAVLEEGPPSDEGEPPAVVGDDPPPVMFEARHLQPGDVDPWQEEIAPVVQAPIAAAPADDGEVTAEAPSYSDL